MSNTDIRVQTGGDKTDKDKRLPVVPERMIVTDFEVHRTLPYLWYSGALSEEEFLIKALSTLLAYNSNYSFDEFN